MGGEGDASKAVAKKQVGKEEKKREEKILGVVPAHKSGKDGADGNRNRNGENSRQKDIAQSIVYDGRVTGKRRERFVEEGGEGVRGGGIYLTFVRTLLRLPWRKNTDGGKTKLI